MRIGRLVLVKVNMARPDVGLMKRAQPTELHQICRERGTVLNAPTSAALRRRHRQH